MKRATTPPGTVRDERGVLRSECCRESIVVENVDGVVMSCCAACSTELDTARSTIACA